MNIKSTGFTIVNDNKTLRELNRAGKIIWPVLQHGTNSNGKPFHYVDEVDGIGMSFEHKGAKYRLQYHSGCFYPYVYMYF